MDRVGNQILISCHPKLEKDTLSDSVLGVRIRIGSDLHHFPDQDGDRHPGISIRIRLIWIGLSIPSTCFFKFFQKILATAKLAPYNHDSFATDEKGKSLQTSIAVNKKFKYFPYFVACLKLGVGSTCRSASF
jgi:hypothetical protein